MVDKTMLKANWMQSCFSRTYKKQARKQDFETFFRPPACGPAGFTSGKKMPRTDRHRLKVLQQKRAGREHQHSRTTTGSSTHHEFVSDTVEALLAYYNGDEARHLSGADIEITKIAAPSLSVSKALENIPKDTMAEKADSATQIDGRALATDKHEVMGCTEFLKRLKTNDSEWYDVLSDYCRQKCAQKKQCVKQAKIFCRSAILVKAAIASEQSLRQASATWSRIYPEMDQEPVDSQLPKGNNLVGWRVKLLAKPRDLQVSTNHPT